MGNHATAAVGRPLLRGLAAIVALALAAALTVAAAAPARADQPVFAPNPHPHSVVVDWIDAMLLAIELNPPAPTATTWRMWLVTSSMYDAWSAYDATAAATQSGWEGKRPARERTDANKAAAISYAAYRSLSFAYPNQEPLFAQVMALHGYPLTDSVATSTPAGIGNRAAQAVIDARIADGSNALGGFQQITSATFPELYHSYNSADPDSHYAVGGDGYDPNRWTPIRVPTGAVVDGNGNPIATDDPASYGDQTFLTPHWGAVTPFALTSGDQYRPPPPPLLGSPTPYTDALGTVTTNDQAFRSQTAEVLAYSGALTDEHKIIAEFWADGPHTWTPPGHWVQLAIGVSLRDGHDIDDDVKMYMALTGATLDAGIYAWDAKRAYDYTRPIYAIRHLYAGQQVLAWGGPDQGAQLIDGADWRPYQSLTFVTPPFAEYVSGHSTFSRASAEVLTAFAGSGAMYDGVTKLGRDYDGDGAEDLFGQHVALPGSMVFEDGPASTVVLTWATFLAAADEAGVSRRYGGIHFQDGDLRAREAGAAIGQQAYQWAELHWDPLGEIADTVAELHRKGQLSRSAFRQLASLANDAARAFAAGRTVKACGQIDDFGEFVALGRGAGVRPVAAAELGRQHAWTTDALCA